MNNILISADSRYPISRPKIKRNLDKILLDKKISSAVEISVLVCGTRQARKLAKKYLREEKPHNVLSFSQEDRKLTGWSVKLGDNKTFLLLGDIVVCYPIAQKEANRDNMMVDEKINELVGHGLLHLLGEHHE